jgi:hypothetical protein
MHVDDGLAAVKLMCSQFVFNLEGLEHNIFAFEESQHAVYLSAAAAPLFSKDHTKLNFGWMLHAMNFFRHHMMNEDAQTLFDKIEELDTIQKPSAWREQLENGARPLNKYWKGTYSFLENSEVQKLRRQGPGKQVYIDKNVDEGKIQVRKLKSPKLCLHPLIPYSPSSSFSHKIASYLMAASCHGHPFLKTVSARLRTTPGGKASRPKAEVLPSPPHPASSLRARARTLRTNTWLSDGSTHCLRKVASLAGSA